MDEYLAMLFAWFSYLFCSMIPLLFLYFPFTPHNPHKHTITNLSRKRRARIKPSEGIYVLPVCPSVARGGLRRSGT